MKMRGLRWWVVGLIAVAAVINYIDRQTLAVLWPTIAADLYPDKTIDERNEIYGLISTIFILAYAFGQAIFGKILDWVGTRIGFALSIGFWSFATVLHAFAKGVTSFSILRVVLGVAEAGNWPGAAKGNAEWFPAKQRALAQGIFNAGASFGGLVSIPIIGYLALVMSWQMIFIVVGLIGFLWLVPWLVLVKAPPEKHPWITKEEREFILSGQLSSSESADKPVDAYNPSTAELLSRKQSWGVIIASAAIDPIWWLFVVWIPIYLSTSFGMDVGEIARFGWVPFVGAMVGALFGGFVSQSLMKREWSVNAVRKLVITFGGVIMLVCLLALAKPASPLIAVLIMAGVLFGFQIAISSVQTLPADMFGGKTVGTLAGFAGMAAKFAAAGVTFIIPAITAGGNFAPAFVFGAGLAITALLAIWLLCPKIEPLKPKN
ncbi:ExuT transport protein [Neiella marina]|uniref:ExuT transport protein n=1 Tax=Neiella marina TaxID=508461 RepID=A0A8J2XMK5_9GAMM|nr:MFS transporter [Neiella marina]GGA65136.1 ExuT transport protein [Neiella marina]